MQKQPTHMPDMAQEKLDDTNLLSVTRPLASLVPYLDNSPTGETH